VPVYGSSRIDLQVHCRNGVVQRAHVCVEVGSVQLKSVTGQFAVVSFQSFAALLHVTHCGFRQLSSHSHFGRVPFAGLLQLSTGMGSNVVMRRRN
jgi:hypothetical protein